MRGFWVRAWSEDLDVHTAEDMAAVAGRAGMDQRTIGECLEAARSQEVKQRLKEVTAEAVDRGAFGSPTMFFSEGEADTEHMFWGSDRSGDGTDCNQSPSSPLWPGSRWWRLCTASRGWGRTPAPRGPDTTAGRLAGDPRVDAVNSEVTEQIGHDKQKNLMMHNFLPNHAVR